MFERLKNRLLIDTYNKVLVRFELADSNHYEEAIDADNLEQRVAELKNELNPKKIIPEIKFVWCLVGNVIDKHNSNDEEIIGTKHFLPNTKIYCLGKQWDDSENIKVIGRHKDNNKYVCIVMPTKLIYNWRLQKVYRPYILKVMNTKHSWTDSEFDKEIIQRIAERRNSNNK